MVGNVIIGGKPVWVDSDEIDLIIKNLRFLRHQFQQKALEPTIPSNEPHLEAIFDPADSRFLVFDGTPLGCTLRKEDDPMAMRTEGIFLGRAAEVKLFHLLRDRHKERERG